MHSTLKALATGASAILLTGISLAATAQEGPLVTAEWVQENLQNPNLRIFEVSVDTGVYERGHIPGAVNFPWGGAVNEDGRFKSPDELKAAFAALGIDGSKPIITYCRIGERSSHTWFVLSRILGYEVRNYDGSWTEYGNAVGVPIENPSGTVWGKI